MVYISQCAEVGNYETSDHTKEMSVSKTLPLMSGGSHRSAGEKRWKKDEEMLQNAS